MDEDIMLNGKMFRPASKNEVKDIRTQSPNKTWIHLAFEEMCRSTFPTDSTQ